MALMDNGEESGEARLFVSEMDSPASRSHQDRAFFFYFGAFLTDDPYQA